MSCVIRRGESFRLKWGLEQTDGSVVTTATVTAYVNDPATGLDLDFDDMTFKASGHVERTVTLPHVSGGDYDYGSDIDSGAFVNFPGTSRNLFGWVHVTEATLGLNYDARNPIVITVDPPANVLAVTTGTSVDARIYRNMQVAQLMIHGEDVTYTPPGGSAGPTIKAIVIRPTVPVPVGGGMEIAFEMPTVHMRVADLGVESMRKGGKITTANEVYEVVAPPQLDGEGWLSAQMAEST